MRAILKMPAKKSDAFDVGAGYVGLAFVGGLIIGAGVSILKNIGWGLISFGGVLVLVGSVAAVTILSSTTRRT